MIDYKKELNEEQYKAVMHDKGPALLLAGAGTGKTWCGCADCNTWNSG